MSTARLVTTTCDGLRRSSRAFAATAHNPNLRRIQASFGAAWTAEWMFTVVLGVVAFRHGGTRAVGVVGFVRIAPTALIAPFGSALGDRFRRERVLAWCCGVRAVATGAAAVLVAADAPIAAVYGLAVVATAAFAPIRPVHSALLPMLCSTPLELTSANVVRGLLDSLSTLVGPLLVAVLLGAADAEVALGVAGALSVLAAVLTFGLAYEAPPRRGAGGLARVVGETAAGFRALRLNGDAATVSGLAAVQVFTRGGLTVLWVVMALELLDTGEAGVGVLTGAVGVGAVVGSLGASFLVTGRHLAVIQGMGVALWGAPLVVSAALPTEPAVLVLMCAIGVGNALVDVGLFTLIPRFVPEELLARAFGTLESVLLAALATGSLLAPAVVAALGVRGALVAIGAIAPLAVALAWRRLRVVDRSVARRDDDIELFRRVAIFSPLPLPAVENLVLYADRVEFAAGADVVRQGEPGDSFFVIRAGVADVLGDGSLIRTLGRGDGFGEIALISDRPRTTTVRARTALSLDRLDRAPFLALIGNYASSAVHADQLVSGRLDRFDPG